MSSATRHFCPAAADVFIADDVPPMADGCDGVLDYLLDDSTDWLKPRRHPQAAARLTALLTTLAIAVNEAADTATAFHRCLKHICAYGRWTLGHVATFAPGTGPRVPVHSYWRTADRSRFAEFIAQRDATDYRALPGTFIGAVFRSQHPKWLADLQAYRQGGNGIRMLRDLGMRSGFAFPVVVNGETLAVLEFFAAEPQGIDDALLAAITAVSAQLARVLEREIAHDALRESRRRMADILGALTEAVFSCKPHTYECIYANPATATLFGGSLERFVKETELWRKCIHPDDRDLVLARLPALYREGSLELVHRIVRFDGDVRHVRTRLHLIKDDAGEPCRVDGMITDVTSTEEARAQRDCLVNYDPVTGLPNRTLFHDRIKGAMSRAKRGGKSVALLLVDLKRFRDVNKHLGYEIGDRVLRETARRLEAVVRDVDTVARLGGDRFALLIEGLEGKQEQGALAVKVLHALELPFVFEGRELFVSASIGISSYPPDASGHEALLKAAEFAARAAKLHGGESFEFYSAADDPASAERFDLEMKLRRALENDELSVHYQPKVDLRTRKITGAEALLRWNHPGLGTISPAKFIPLAEETGLILPIGAWVLNTACRQAKRWQDAGLDLEIAVNLSARQFRDKNLLGIVADALNTTGLDPERLELEITETMALERPEHAAILIKSLRGLGVRIALDDFGTGWSSLSHMRRLPIDHIKIDRSFISEIAHNHEDRAIVAAVTKLSHTLGLRITAEGVEDEAQAETLLDCGCDQFQGYYFSKPLPAEQFDALLPAAEPDKDQRLAGRTVRA